MLKIKEDDFEDLEHYREMFAVLRDNAFKIIEMYKQNNSEIEVGFLLGKLYSLASDNHVEMINTLSEVTEYNIIGTD